MNFIDACKTGRPFKRESWHGYVTGVQRGDSNGRYPVTLYWTDNSPAGIRHAVGVEEIFADDWEVQEPTVSISTKQFWEAVDASYSFSPLQGFSDSRGSWVSLDAIHQHSLERMSKLAEKLGLGPRGESSR